MNRLSSKIFNQKNESWVLIPLFTRYMISNTCRIKYSRIIREGKDTDIDALLPVTNDRITLENDLGEKVEIKVSNLAYVCFIDINTHLGKDFTVKIEDNKPVYAANVIINKDRFTTIYDLIYLALKDRQLVEMLSADVQDSCQNVRSRLLFKNGAYVFINEVTKEPVYNEEVMASKQTCIDRSVMAGTFQVGNIYDISIYKSRDKLTFGIHKGKTVSEVRKIDPDHLRWINSNMPHAVIEIKL